MSIFLDVIPVALRAMVPLTLTAIGEIFAERAGVVNIGLEGMMTLSAFLAAAAAWAIGNPWVGVLAGMVAGAFVGFLHGVISVHWKGNQVVSGVGINLLGMGSVGFGAWALWGTKSPMLDRAFWIPSVSLFGFRLSPFVLATPLLVFLTWWILQRTALGLRVRAIGEAPVAADVVGVDVARLRLLAVVYGGALAGLAGAFLSLDWLHTVHSALPAGRGFISLANVVFSKLNPFLALAGGALFGYFDALAIQVASVTSSAGGIPYQFVRMVPYVVTLAVVTLAIGRARFPAALGQPYRRE